MGFLGITLMIVPIIIIVLIVLFMGLILSFAVGSSLVAAGIFKGDSTSPAGRKVRIFCIVFGLILAVPALYFLIPIGKSYYNTNKSYNNPKDRWINTVTNEKEVYYDAIKNIIMYSKDQNKEGLMNLFSDEILKNHKDELSYQIDEYLKTVPKDLDTYLLVFEEKLIKGNKTLFYDLDLKYKDGKNNELVGIKRFSLYGEANFSKEHKSKEKYIKIDMDNKEGIKTIYFGSNYPVNYVSNDRKIDLKKALSDLEIIDNINDFIRIYGEPTFNKDGAYYETNDGFLKIGYAYSNKIYEAKEFCTLEKSSENNYICKNISFTSKDNLGGSYDS